MADVFVFFHLSATNLRKSANVNEITSKNLQKYSYLFVNQTFVNVC